jgi:CheY-like chemotaxis protein
MRILLVEDDEDDYLLTRDLIADMNHRQYTLDWVPDFDTAVEAIGRGEHDVYLFDYRLGAHDGIELLREAKKMRGPAILLTGQGASDLDVAALQAGASDYLDKQRLDAGSLERAILYGLHQKRRQDELERLVSVGMSDGARVLLEVTPDLVLRLTAQPAADPALMLSLRTAGGKVALFDSAGSPWPAGISPAGMWAELADIDSDLTAVGGLSPAFVEEATYDPAANSWDIRFEGERSLADLLKVQAG